MLRLEAVGVPRSPPTKQAKLSGYRLPVADSSPAAVAAVDQQEVTTTSSYSSSTSKTIGSFENHHTLSKTKCGVLPNGSRGQTPYSTVSLDSSLIAGIGKSKPLSPPKSAGLNAMMRKWAGTNKKKITGGAHLKPLLQGEQLVERSLSLSSSSNSNGMISNNLQLCLDAVDTDDRLGHSNYMFRGTGALHMAPPVMSKTGLQILEELSVDDGRQHHHHRDHRAAATTGHQDDMSTASDNFFVVIRTDAAAVSGGVTDAGAGVAGGTIKNLQSLFHNGGRITFGDSCGVGEGEGEGEGEGDNIGNHFESPTHVALAKEDDERGGGGGGNSANYSPRRSRISLVGEDSLLPGESAPPYLVHKRILGWKLTSQSRRKEIVNMMEHSYTISRGGGGGTEYPSRSLQSSAGGLFPGMFHNSSSAGGGSPMLRKIVPATEECRRRQVESWERSVSRQMRAREKTPDGFGSKQRGIKDRQLKRVLSAQIVGGSFPFPESSREEDVTHYMGPIDRMGIIAEANKHH